MASALQQKQGAMITKEQSQTKSKLGPPKGCCFVGFMYQKTINPQNKTLGAGDNNVTPPLREPFGTSLAREEESVTIARRS